jgi:hypothetical protein
MTWVCTSWSVIPSLFVRVSGANPAIETALSAEIRYFSERCGKTVTSYSGLLQSRHLVVFHLRATVFNCGIAAVEQLL